MHDFIEVPGTTLLELLGARHESRPIGGNPPSVRRALNPSVLRERYSDT